MEEEDFYSMLRNSSALPKAGAASDLSYRAAFDPPLPPWKLLQNQQMDMAWKATATVAAGTLRETSFFF